MALSTVVQANRKEEESKQRIQTLLAAAKLEGGAIAEVAEELTHPRRSIFSTVGDGFKNAFSGFIDVIQMPQNIVAGALSSDYTIGEAMKYDVTPSDVLFGEQDETDTFIQKTGEFSKRFAVDVLLDPLTYVTFGASAGVMGVRALPRIKAGANVAKKLGIEVGEDAVLSEKGFKYFKEAMKSQKNGLRSQFLKQQRDVITSSIRKAGGVVDEVQVASQLKEISRKTSDAMIEATLGKRLDTEFTLNTVSNLLENNPALMETFLDKGGIKFFSKSILSGQRLKAVKQVIPGMTWLDHATMPIRDKVSSLFDPDYIAPGFKSAEISTLRRKYKDLATIKKNELLSQAENLYQGLNITETEEKLIRAAIEADKRPADQRLAAVWDSLNGIEPDQNVIPADVLNAAGFVKSKLKHNLKELRARGVPITEQSNYFPHLLVKEQVKIPFLPKQLKTAGKVASQKAAGFSAFIDEAGERILGYGEFKGKGSKQTLEVNVLDEAGKVTEKKVLEKTTDKDVFLDGLTGEQIKRVRATVDEVNKLDSSVKFEERAILGAVRNSFDVINFTVQRDFLTDFAKIAGKPASEAPAGWRAINVAELKETGGSLTNYILSKKGEEIVFHPKLAEYAEKFVGGVAKGDPTDEFFKAYDSIQNFFKASVTSIWPAFHGRNAISNVFLNYLDLGINALRPEYHVAANALTVKNYQATRLENIIGQGLFAPKNSDLYKKAIEAQGQLAKLNQMEVFEDAFGRKWNFSELRATLKENVIAFQPNITGAIDYNKLPNEALEDMFEGLYTPDTIRGKIQKGISFKNPITEKRTRVIGSKNLMDNLLMSTGGEMGKMVENHARMVHFLANMKNVGDVGLAAQRTKQFLFDYSNITDFERKVMKRIIPFYTFARKNMELQVKTLLKDPGRIAAEVKFIENIGDVISSSSLSEEDKEKLPDWIKDGQQILLRKRGQDVTILGSAGTPLEAAFAQATPTGILGGVSPLVKYPVELMSGYSFFHEKSIDQIDNASAFNSAPDVIKDFIGFSEVKGKRPDGTEYKYSVALRPERMYAIMNLPGLSRVFSSLKQMEAVDVDEQYKIIGFLTGYKPYSFNLDVEEQRREKELIKQIEAKLDAAGVGYSFSRFVLPEQR
jgi:hypothetical protein